MAMENGPFIDDFPIKPPFMRIYEGFSMAMLNNQMIHGLTKYGNSYPLVNIYITMENIYNHF